MLDKYLLIFFFQLIFSYFAFKYYYSTSLFPVEFDEFTLFERNKVVNGAGIIFLFSFLIFFLIFFFNFNFYVPEKIYIFLISLVILSLISFFDDIKNLDPILRLIIQLVCVYLSLATVPHLIDFLPIKLSIIIILFIWVYIININNFIDGADGFCTTISISFFLSVLFLCIYYDLNLFSKFISLLVLPSLLIFKLFNVPPAKLFMGDAGSIFLGFLIGYCIIELSFNDFYYFAFAAFAYPIVDCSITLFKKTLKGYLPWTRLGDYYFLLPKKRKKNLNFLIVEKKIYTGILILSLGNLCNLIFSAYIDMQYLSLLNFLSSLMLLILFRSHRV
jgi:UDP-N-acetylmuramyl pentapeptide phosphotransferase/UDP-N-acetylglucosamine-1-phosphate transferase